MATLVLVGTYLLGLAAAVALGSLGVFLGWKLSRFRHHRKSEELQTLFSNRRLD